MEYIEGLELLLTAIFFVSCFIELRSKKHKKFYINSVTVYTLLGSIITIVDFLVNQKNPPTIVSTILCFIFVIIFFLKRKYIYHLITVNIITSILIATFDTKFSHLARLSSILITLGLSIFFYYFLKKKYNLKNFKDLYKNT